MRMLGERFAVQTLQLCLLSGFHLETQCVCAPSSRKNDALFMVASVLGRLSCINSCFVSKSRST